MTDIHVDKFEPFVSPITKKVIKSKKALNEHNRRHNVTNAADFSPEYTSNKQKERVLAEKRDLDESRKNDILAMIAAMDAADRQYNPCMIDLTYNPNMVYLF